MTDNRKLFLQNVIKCAFHDVTLSEIIYNDYFDTFLNDISCNILCIEKRDGELRFSYKLNTSEDTGKQLIFLKQTAAIITEDSISNVSIQTIIGSPLSCLQQTINHIFMPALFQNGTIPYLQQGLALIQSGLKFSNNQDLNITKISDEIYYWQHISETGKDKAKAESFLSVLKPLESELSGLLGLNLIDLEELIDVITSGLDDLWRLESDFEYPQDRMEKLLDAIGSNIILYIQRLLASIDVWHDDYNVTFDILQMGLKAAEKWPKALNQLLTIFWGPSSDRPWPGNKSLGNLELFKGILKRLEDIKYVRLTHRQLTRLLSSSEQRELGTSELFSSFTGVRPEVWSPFLEDNWKSCLQQFEKGLKPAEKRVAGKLRTQFRHLNTNTLQLLQELRRYEELLKRPSIAAELISERENLLGLLFDYMRNIDLNESRKEFALDVPQVVSNIYWAQHLKSKIGEILDTNKKLLDDLKDSGKLKEKAEELLKEVISYENDEFQNWLREVNQGIKSGELRLSAENKVLEIKEARMVAVTYNPRIGQLVKEVQKLSALGFSIPEKISQLFHQAIDLVKQASALEQVKIFMLGFRSLEKIANFHNTIGDRMIPCQKPMMLASAQNLENLILTKTEVTWLEKDKLDRYIGELQDAVELLARQNNMLTFWHEQLGIKVCQLMETDIVRKQSDWKIGLRDIREIFAQAEENKFVNMRGWKTHWDVQLYKALERQYQLSLTNLHSNLHEIKVELVYRQQKLQFNPPLEEIKLKHYGQVKKFLSLPKSFRGVGETSPDLFSVMIERNSHRFQEVYAEAETLFDKLEKIRINWKRWVALGNFNFEEYAEKTLKKTEDWDFNFRASKNFAQEIAKLPYSDEKVGCILVSLVPIRTEMELQNRRYWDFLVISLQSSILKSCREVNLFVEESTKLLNTPPKKIDEVPDAYQNHSKILQKSNEIENVLEEMIKKNKTLASWTKEKIEAVYQTANDWEAFRFNLQNFESIIRRQVEQMKASTKTDAENLISEAEKFALRWQQLRPKDTDLLDATEENLLKCVSIIKEKTEEWQLIKEHRDKLLLDFSQFNLDTPDFQRLNDIEIELNGYKEIWSNYKDFTDELNEISKEEWILFRSKLYTLDEFFAVWETKLQNNESAVAIRILQEIQTLKSLAPLLKFLRGEVFSERHWIELCQMLEMPNKPPEALTLGDFLKVKNTIIKSEEQLQELNSRATSEISIRQALAELDAWEVQARFSLVEHVDSRCNQITLLQDFEDVLNKLADNQCLVQNILRVGKNKSGFVDRAETWERKLGLIEEAVKNLNTVQRKWVYLEPIFGNGSFTMEFSRFQRIDQDFRHIMKEISRDNHVVALARIPNLGQSLAAMLQQLSKCQDSLDKFLQEKRQSFPRFYFLSDDNLLELLGQSQKESVIQAHLKKLFAGIHSVIIENGLLIAVCSIEGEKVQLSKSIPTTNQVEVWLSELNNEMKKTLQELLISCLKDQNPDPYKYPTQILCLAESVWFTNQCEEAINSRKLSQFLGVLKEKLENYSNHNFNLAKPNDILSLKLKALLMDTVYHISIVETLIKENAISVADWNWQKQLRFYVDSNNKASTRMVDAEVPYTYEYQGIAPKLVRTPLTERCFLTMTQAIKCCLGGNPLGPAGTGKTESVKALGGLLGRQVLVFNCDEGIDVQSIGRIFTGIIKCGAWGCFDEFNRLEESTLSTVSMLIEPIQASLKERKTKVTLLNEEVEMDLNCGLFVTLNPAGRGYGGRQKLPDNLKKLFRPVIMSAPDQQLIAQVSLFCDGFKEAKLIARKLVELFENCGQVLSRQQHYDWGLRALKTVLGSCGSLLKEFRFKTTEVGLKEELQLVVQAVRLNTLSKLSFSDSKMFDSLVRDVFLEVPFIESGLTELMDALHKACDDLELQISTTQIKKCLEVYEQMQQRMGVAVVGPPRVGKSSILKILQQALTRLGQQVECLILNPKAMSRIELLGYINPDTRQWIEGVLTQAAAKITTTSSATKAWLICDGDVDPEWIESLNSVLDDNRLLTLPSGWRIQFGPNVNFIFETCDLNHASPATISRLGTILLSEETFDISLFVKSWLKRQPEDKVAILKPFLEDYFNDCLEWVLKNGKTVVSCSKISLVSSALSLMENVTNRQQFMIAMIWGLGSNLDLDTKTKFSQHVFRMFAEQVPVGCNILDCFYNKSNHRIDYFYSDDFETETSDLIMTKSTKRNIGILEYWLRNQDPLLISGPPGCGIGVLLNYCLHQLPMAEIAEIYCSSLTTPNHILYKLKQFCVSVTGPGGKILRLKSGNSLVLCLKNLELAAPDKYGTNMLLAWLQHLITYKGFFDSDVQWTSLGNIQIVAVVSPIGYKLPTRLTSLMRIFNFVQPDWDDLKLVNSLSMRNISKSDKIMETAIRIFREISAKLYPGWKKHYSFTPKHFSEWCRGIKKYPTDSSIKTILVALCYEGFRIFGDRLTVDDKKYFCEVFKANLETDWGLGGIVDTVENLCFVQNGEKFEELQLEDWRKVVTKNITVATNGEKDIILTKELVSLTKAVDRCVSIPGKSIVLAGRPGIGRKLAAKAIASRHNARYMTLSRAIKYSMKQLRNDLKSVLLASGVEGNPVVFVVEDNQIRDYIHIILNLITSGEVYGVFSAEEFESILGTFSDGEEKLMEFFISRIKNNLHVIFVMDFEDPDFSTVLEKNPSLCSKLDFVWISNWSEESLGKIPSVLLSDFDLENVEEFSTMIKSVQSLYETPRRYISFVTLFIKIYNQKKLEFSRKLNGLQNGVSKLTETQTVVDRLKKIAAKQKEELAEKQAKASAALDMISETMRNANTHKEEMERLKDRTVNEGLVLKEKKREIEKELAEVEPLVEEAKQAVGNIRNEALSEIRSLRAPPDVIRDILEGVLRLMGIQDTSWNSMKTFLAKRGVKEEIRGFDAHKITKESRKAVELLLKDRGKSFDLQIAKRASVAAAPLAEWVKANISYAQILEKIRPLEEEQSELVGSLQKSEEKVGKLSSSLEEVDSRVKELKNQLNTYTREAAVIEINLNKEAKTVAAAEDLINKLQDEHERWKKQLLEVTEDLKNLKKNVLISAGFISYLASESDEKRRIILKEWLTFLHHDFQIIKFLSSERERVTWISEGLPNDFLTLENTIALLYSEIRPLIIDPSGHAKDWMISHFGKDNIELISQENPRFINILEVAVRFGKILLVENVNKIHELLFPLLRNDFVQQGGRKMILIGEKLVDYHESFRLFLLSSNHEIKPCFDVTIIDYSTTVEGLAGQLLAAAIDQEQPELGTQRNHLLKEQEEMSLRLFDLQEKLLKELASAEGDILQNEDLFKSLNQTKASSEEIGEALGKASLLERKLNEECVSYKELTFFAANMYFALGPLTALNRMYCYSVSAFKDLFLKSLKLSRGENVDTQKSLLIKQTFNYVSKSLFNLDRLPFALQLIKHCFSSSGTEGEWQYLFGDVVAGKDKPNEIPAWVEEERHKDVATLQNHLPDFYKKLNIENSKWIEFGKSAQCEEDDIPDSKNLSLLQRVLVVKAFRPDRLHSTLTDFACRMLNIETLAPHFKFQTVYESSKNTEPILLIISSSSDPSDEINKLANQLKVDLNEVSMGQDQAVRALKVLRESAEKGDWVCLKNPHLMIDWLMELEQVYRELVNVHKNFRLWMITEAHPKFPTWLCQRSLKIGFATPPGLKKNLLRTYTNWSPSVFQKKGPIFGKLLFLTAWFHAVLQERRTFVPQGWTKFYEISDMDLSAALDILQRVITPGERQQVPWDFIHGLFYQTIYGGRIDAPIDTEILLVYLREYFQQGVLEGRSFARGLSLPQAENQSDYLKFIHQLPNEDDPRLFGLAANIQRSWQKIESERVLNKLKGLGSKLQDFDTDSWSLTLTPILNTWKNLHQGLSLIGQKALENESSDTLKNCVGKQYTLGLQLVNLIHKHLALITRVMKKTVSPDFGLIQILTNLTKNEVPTAWSKHWLGPETPKSYLTKIVQKTAALKNLQNLDKGVDLSIFFYPEAFLKTLKQLTSREENIALDELAICCQWKVTAENQLRCRINNLLLQGAFYQNGRFIHTTEISPSVSLAPPFVIYFARKNEHSRQETIVFPCYKDETREELIMRINVPCEGSQNDWLKAGAAFFCS